MTPPKVALVTGASSGIGFQIASDLLKQGFRVGAHFSSNDKGARRLVRMAASGRCRVFQADFSSSSQVLRFWKEVLAWSGGRIDVLVNNAGTVPPRSEFEKVSEGDWDRTFAVNLKAPFLLCQRALSQMAQRGGGRIINISSVGVKFGGSPQTVPYSVSKAGLEALTRSLAKIGAPKGVLVNAVQPGLTDTPLHGKSGRKDLARRVSMIPMGRMATASEISAAVLFLAGEDSSYVSGAVLCVAGGE